MARIAETDESGGLDGAAVRRHFERAAEGFDAAAALPREIGERLLERLDVIRLQPARALDLGAGTGAVAEALLRRYRGAQIYAVDSAAAMLDLARRRGGWRRRPRVVCADAGRLPLAADSLDMVVSNLMLPWCLPPDAVFAEIRRVLAPDGVLLFSTLGPDTLAELRSAWAQVDAQPHVHPFMDMHDIGDALLRAGFADPVMDAERLQVTYPDVPALLRELKSLGAGNALVGRAPGLGGRGRLKAMIEAYEPGADGRIRATCEVVYGLAWGAAGVPARSGEARVPLETLRRPRRARE
ncbi:malonyl-ACP O-methyltransferase BioC [Acidihalobacter prosperus]